MMETKRWTLKRKCIFGLALIICLGAITLVIVLPLSLHKPVETKVNDLTTAKPPENIRWPEVENVDGQKYRYAAASCAHKACSTVGTDVMAEGGSAVDAGISVALCLGVLRPTSSGIGGGAFATFYNKTEKKAYAYNFRETAPAAANSTMYDNSKQGHLYGGTASAIPGELKGFWELHQRFGRLSWKRLFEPAIRFARDGFPLDEYVYGGIQQFQDKLETHLLATFKHADGTFIQPDEVFSRPRLAATLQTIADEGAHVFYNGSLAAEILADLQDQGSIITAEDLINYNVSIKDPVTSQITSHNCNFSLYSVPLPSGGIVVEYILQILNGYQFTPESASPSPDRVQQTGLTYHRIVEALKFGYAMRSHLGDEDFDTNLTNVERIKNMTSADFTDSIRRLITDARTQNASYYGGSADPRETTGTSQISIISPHGDAFSLTTSVNAVFGNKNIGNRTGIIFNNHMADFSRPGSPSYRDDAWLAPSNQANWIEPGKRPLSAMSPLIITDKNGTVRMVTGGSGGSKIITAIVQSIINTLWFGIELPAAVSRPRFHHQLLPDKLFMELNFPEEYVDVLKSKGHNVVDFGHGAVADSVAVEGHIVRGGADPRRLGVSDGF